MKKEFVKLSAVLCLITLVAALVLAGVNTITAPAIEKAEKEATEKAMKNLLPDAEEFETYETVFVINCLGMCAFCIMHYSGT